MKEQHEQKKVSDAAKLKGAIYGYPQCCIDEYVSETEQSVSYTWLVSGFIPCETCKSKKPSEVIKHIKEHRRYPIPFPFSLSTIDYHDSLSDELMLELTTVMDLPPTVYQDNLKANASISIATVRSNQRVLDVAKILADFLDYPISMIMEIAKQTTDEYAAKHRYLDGSSLETYAYKVVIDELKGK